jgi:hypothetical protein
LNHAAVKGSGSNPKLVCGCGGTGGKVVARLAGQHMVIYIIMPLHWSGNNMKILVQLVNWVKEPEQHQETIWNPAGKCDICYLES